MPCSNVVTVLAVKRPRNPGKSNRCSRMTLVVTSCSKIATTPIHTFTFLLYAAACFAHVQFTPYCAPPETLCASAPQLFNVRARDESGRHGEPKNQHSARNSRFIFIYIATMSSLHTSANAQQTRFAVSESSMCDKSKT